MGRPDLISSPSRSRPVGQKSRTGNPWVENQASDRPAQSPTAHGRSSPAYRRARPRAAREKYFGLWRTVDGLRPVGPRIGGKKRTGRKGKQGGKAEGRPANQPNHDQLARFPTGVGSQIGPVEPVGPVGTVDLVKCAGGTDGRWELATSWSPTPVPGGSERGR